MISAVVLASALAEQNGSSDSPPPMRGTPATLQALLESAIHSKLTEVICVVPGLALGHPQFSVADEKLFWLVDYGADRGKSHSMIAGLWTVDPQSAGVLFLSGDQPPVSKTLIDALMGGFERSSAWIIAPSVQGEPRKPLLFRRDLFPELLKLSGDREGLELIDKYRAKTTLIEWSNGARSRNRPARPRLSDRD